MVGDFFCGCGTTLEAAMNWNRGFVGCDGQSIAISTIKGRMLKRGKIRYIKIEDPFVGIPKTLEKQNH